jgi:drug/metabolite transporter (DMT)-like permease
VKRATAVALLLVTTFFWGVTFTVVKEAVARVDVFVFLAQRFVAAAALLAGLAAARGGRLDARALRGGAAMGFALFLSYAFQTMALRFTSASNTGFLTGLSVVLVPLGGALLLRQRIAPALWGAVGLATLGLFLLTTNGAWALNAGDALAAVCAVCVAAHLLLTGRYSGGSDVWWLTAVQIGVVGACSTAVALGSGAALFVWHPFLLWPLVICVLFATVFAFLAQTAVQRMLSPTSTALIFCMEPVFAAIWAYGALGERLGLVGYAGAALILAGMLLAELGPGRAEPGPG